MRHKQRNLMLIVAVTVSSCATMHAQGATVQVVGLTQNGTPLDMLVTDIDLNAVDSDGSPQQADYFIPEGSIAYTIGSSISETLFDLQVEVTNAIVGDSFGDSVVFTASDADGGFQIAFVSESVDAIGSLELVTALADFGNNSSLFNEIPLFHVDDTAGTFFSDPLVNPQVTVSIIPEPNALLIWSLLAMIVYAAHQKRRAIG